MEGEKGFEVIIISALPMLKGLLNEAIYYYEKARGLRPDDEDLGVNIRYLQSVKDREEEKVKVENTKTALQPNYTSEGKQMDSDEGVAIVTGEGMEAILRMQLKGRRRGQGAFRLDIEGHQEGSTGWNRGRMAEGLVGLPRSKWWGFLMG